MIDFQQLMSLDIGLRIDSGDVENINSALEGRLLDVALSGGLSDDKEDFSGFLDTFIGGTASTPRSPGPLEAKHIRLIHNYFLIRSILQNDATSASRSIQNGADVNARCYLSENKTYYPLVQAAIVGSLEIVKLLVESGADVNQQQMNGESALANAANIASREHLQIAQYLLEHGANPNIIAHSKLTPLAVADNSKMVRLLLDHGADPNIADSDGDLPVVARIVNGDVESISLLIAVGTNLDHPNVNGVSARAHANKLGVPLEHDPIGQNACKQDKPDDSGSFQAKYLELHVDLVMLALYYKNVSSWMSARNWGNNAQTFSDLSNYLHSAAADYVYQLSEYDRAFPVPRSVLNSMQSPPDVGAYNALIQKQYSDDVAISADMTDSMILGRAIEFAEIAFQDSLLAVQTATREDAYLEMMYLCGDRGVVWGLARVAHSLQSLSFHLVDRKSLTFFPESEDSPALSVPFMDTSFDGATTKYVPAELVFMRFPNEDGNIVTGQVVEALGRRGEFIRCASPEEWERISEVAENWVFGLRQELVASNSKWSEDRERVKSMFVYARPFKPEDRLDEDEEIPF